MSAKVGQRVFLQSLLRLVVLLLGITTVLFFALRAAGDPITVLAGQDASPELIERLRAQYGLDQPLWLQYLRYMGDVLRLQFGDSLSTGQPALLYVLRQVPATLLLTMLAMMVTIGVSVPVGAWLGQDPLAFNRKCAATLVFIAQGVPGYIVALVLLQIFVVRLGWLPSLGYADVRTWILPSIALAFFLAPKLIRVIAANVAEAMQQEYVRTARANGASPARLLWREALPNALLGATALISTQFAFLISGAVLIEVLFLWPGIGLLLLRSAQTLDFPVLQAIAFVVAILVFLVNSFAEILFKKIDPRLRISSVQRPEAS